MKSRDYIGGFQQKERSDLTEYRQDIDVVKDKMIITPL